MLAVLLVFAPLGYARRRSNPGSVFSPEKIFIVKLTFFGHALRHPLSHQA
jgi:hypothetical protein